MSKIEHNLEDIGLTKTESALYVLGLKLGGKCTVFELQKHSSIKRPTMYHALNTLADKGLVAKVQQEGRVLFRFSAPSQLQSFAKEKLKEARDTLESAQLLAPALESLMGTPTSKTSVGHYEGEVGVRSVIENALYCRSSTWSIIAPKVNYFTQTDSDYAQYFMRTRKQKGITAKSLWEQKPQSKQSVSAELLKQRNPRLLPPEMHGAFQSLMIIYDNKVALISSHDDLSAILIESEELNQFFSALFGTLWQASKPIS